MYDTVFTERLHKPSVVLVNEGFMFDARSAASGKGMPNVRVVAETVPCECTVPDRITAGVRGVVDELVFALTKPLTEEERSPRPPEVDSASGVVFEGDLAEVQRFFYRRGWTDGLPIIPPTEKAVAEMLTGTDLPRDHVVGKMIPRLGKVTVEKIAINAVMAGCLPTVMPVLIAGVEALLDKRGAFGTFEVSTGSWAPFYIINGPIRAQLNVRSSSGTLSPGDIANATIGRAMGLIVKNVGGARKAMEDMGVLGNPMKYSMVAGENEEANPPGWDPLHVEQGFARDENCLTVSFPNSYQQIAPRGSDAEGVLNSIAANIGPRWQQRTLLVPPGQAQTLCDAGWTKQRIAQRLFEAAGSPEPRGGPSFTPGQDRGAGWVKVVLVGGPGVFVGMASSVGTWVTKPIQLPAEWDALVKKYKNYTPTYLQY